MSKTSVPGQKTRGGGSPACLGLTIGFDVLGLVFATVLFVKSIKNYNIRIENKRHIAEKHFPPYRII